MQSVKKTNQSEKYVFFLIMALASALRLICLGTMPEGMHQDEGFVAWNAYAIYHDHMDSAGHIFPVYMTDWGDGHSALYVWLTIPFIALNKGHISIFLARLPQAIAAILSIAAVYGIVKRVLSKKAALWCSFLLAICPWHVMMSRWGLDANLAPAFLMFGLYFFIRGMENQKYLLVSALFYGLSLYCYAVIWPIVPFLLICQISYGLRYKKLHINLYSILSSVLLFVMALPLLLFVLVNSEIIPEISLPFMTIPLMNGYRGGEIAITPGAMWGNLRKTLYFLRYQNVCAPYDLILPWGLFYDIGRVFIVIGAAVLTGKVVKSFIKKEFKLETFLFIQLMGGGLVSMLVSVTFHQINALYIPLVLCEAYGVWVSIQCLKQRNIFAGRVYAVVLVLVYCLCLVGFQKDYYTEYRKVSDVFYGAGLKDSVNYAMMMCQDKGFTTITAERSVQWPRLMLYTEVKSSEYIETVVYDAPPEPASFEAKGILIRNGIDKEQLDPQSVYILYYADKPLFEQDYELTEFHDWYVAVPK